MTPEPTPVSGMTPRLPASDEPVDRDPDDGRADLGGDVDRGRRLVDRDRLRRADVGALRRDRAADGPVEDARRAQRQDGPARREHGRQQRDTATSDPAPTPRRCAAVVARSGWVAGAGSYQRSGVGGPAASHWLAHSARGSGAGRVAIGRGDAPARPTGVDGGSLRRGAGVGRRIVEALRSASGSVAAGRGWSSIMVVGVLASAGR